MTPARERAGIQIALLGNPNTGKTSLFNALTGFTRQVANYPGVTVEIAIGRLCGAALPVELVDLPGTYSLAATSPDEAIVSDLVCGRVSDRRPPGAILAIVDACNLPRNLYLLSQVLELGLPVVVAVNMIDIANSRGIRIDCAKLAQRLGVPVVPVAAVQPDTLPPLLSALEDMCRGCRPAPRPSIAHAVSAATPHSPAVDASAVRARYAWIAQVLDGVLSRPSVPLNTWSDRIDRVVMHKVMGGLVLLSVLFVLFQSIFSWAGPVMDLIESAFGGLGDAVGALMPEGALRSLVVDGLIGGVGGVLVFLPQILILFAFIAVLEDCGYMARAAHMVDRIMRAAGLSGRAFIPLLSSFACAIPAIMGTRTIGDRRERFVTILIAPFMSCSARLPVYVLLISAFVPPHTYLGGWVGLPGLVMFAMYLVGIIVSIPLAWLLRKTLLAGPAGGFLLEMPSYKWPRPRSIWQRMHHAGRSFIIRAGTVILLVNVVVWALAYFPRSPRVAAEVARQAAEHNWSAQDLEAELDGAYLRDSYLGRAGHAIEPTLRPLGWDWRIGVGVLASFPAREVIVATLGTLFNLGGEQDETSAPLQAALRQARGPDGRPLFTLPVALSIMVFFALCAQCFSTLVIIARETGSWGWAALSFFSMTTIAYLAAWGVAAGGRALGM